MLLSISIHIRMFIYLRFAVRRALDKSIQHFVCCAGPSSDRRFCILLGAKAPHHILLSPPSVYLSLAPDRHTIAMSLSTSGPLYVILGGDQPGILNDR